MGETSAYMVRVYVCWICIGLAQWNSPSDFFTHCDGLCQAFCNPSINSPTGVSLLPNMALVALEVLGLGLLHKHEPLFQ